MPHKDSLPSDVVLEYSLRSPKTSAFPIVSIIVPVSNVEKGLLRQCIESLLAQTLENIEIILVDDGCPSGGGTICDEYAKIDKRIKVIHQPNKGVSAARNAGIEAARGRYITFVDGDDFVAPEYCMELFNAAEETGADITACGADRYEVIHGVFHPFFSGNNTLCRNQEEIRQLALSLLRTMKFKREELNIRVNGYVWAHLYRTECLNELRFDPRLLGGEDRLFNYLALMRCNCFCYINRVLYHYVINSQSLTHKFKPNAIELALETYQIYRNLPEVEQNPECRQAYYIRTCCMALAMVRSYFLHPENPDKEPAIAFRRFCRENLVAEAIQNADIRKMRLCKMKLAIWCLKLRLYEPASWCARYWHL